MPEALHMVQLELDQPHLHRVAREHGWVDRRVDDLGHLVHHQLKALFGDLSPQPFRLLDSSKRWLPVLGYSRADAAALAQRAREVALPADLEEVHLEDMKSKPMPDTIFTRGRSFAFELRGCPVARLASETTVVLDQHDDPHSEVTYRAGTELDAFLHRRDVKREQVSREAVYLDWLGERLEPAARLAGATVHAFRRVRVLRRGRPDDGGRRRQVAERPDVLFRGGLEVTDAGRFRELLARGVGRHKAFGFGMLLLRAPG